MTRSWPGLAKTRDCSSESSTSPDPCGGGNVESDPIVCNPELQGPPRLALVASDRPVGQHRHSAPTGLRREPIELPDRHRVHPADVASKATGRPPPAGRPRQLRGPPVPADTPPPPPSWRSSEPLPSGSRLPGCLYNICQIQQAPCVRCRASGPVDGRRAGGVLWVWRSTPSAFAPRRQDVACVRRARRCVSPLFQPDG